jgi:antirestriction factor ArdC-like protein
MRAAQAKTVPEPPVTTARSHPDHPDWSTLLADAVRTPGIVSQAYSRFWSYSVGNQILAMFQCQLRGLEPGPIHTFRGWLDLGRHVKRGEKAITLCMPVTVNRKLDARALERQQIRGGDGAERQVTGPGGVVTGDGTTVNVTVFAYKPHWFVLSQTEGEPYVPQELPDWSEARALHGLLIDRVPFDHPNGNCQGFATARNVSVSPIAALPHKTLFHELAHVVLGHTEEGRALDDHDRTPVSLREVEAECVALICCESLDLAGAAECRGYIQHWLGKETIPDRSAQRIFKAADQVLKAGLPTATPEMGE